MSPLHRHYCACGCERTCRREDCEEVGWTCPTCEDEQMADFYAVHGDQPRLPLTADTDPLASPLPLEAA